jgi:hypothetical protein
MIQVQYIGEDKFTIKHGTKGTIVGIRRLSATSKFVADGSIPSRIGLWIQLEGGGLFGITCRNQWKRI